jgi:hypothetical protein
MTATSFFIKTPFSPSPHLLPFENRESERNIAMINNIKR